MATISVRMDDALKQETEHILDELGLNMSTAVTMLAKAIVRERRLPIDLSIDPFYSAINQSILSRAIAEYEAGRTQGVKADVNKLEAMAEDE